MFRRPRSPIFGQIQPASGMLVRCADGTRCSQSKLHSSTLFARSDHFLMVKAPPFLGFELIQILEIECKNETYYLMFI